MNDWKALVPISLLCGAGLVCLVAEPFLRRGQSRAIFVFVALAGLFGAAAACVWWLPRPDVTVWQGALRMDDFGLMASIIALGAAALSVLASGSPLESQKRMGGEFFALKLFAASGMVVMALAADLVTLFLGIEIMSLSVYVLAGYDKGRTASNEASLKYFVLGAFSSGLLLLGFVLLYGALGTLTLSEFGLPEANLAALRDDPAALLGMGLVLIGLLFKVGAAPFQIWVPDVYEGAPTCVTAFMAGAVKVAGFAAMMRLLTVLFPIWPDQILLLLAAVALLTIIIGNFLALVQRNVKRLLAYSSIAHTGYLLIGVLVAVQSGVFIDGALTGAGHPLTLGALPTDPEVAAARAGLLFYLAAYALASVGAFTVLGALRRGGHVPERLEDLSGLAGKYPGLSAAFVVFLISLAGLPATAGFIGKFTVLKAAVDASDTLLPLVVLAVLLALVSVAYYLRVIVFLYFRGQGLREAREPFGWDQRLTVLVCVVLTLALGVLPGDFYEYCRRAAENAIGG